MKVCSGAAVVLLSFLFASAAWAGKADVESVTLIQKGNVWRAEVTVRHADTGWDHYADFFRVVTPDGRELGKRILRHPHVDEQPFTRELDPLAIPAGVNAVVVEAHDKVHGFGGKTVTVFMNKTRGRGFKVVRAASSAKSRTRPSKTLTPTQKKQLDKLIADLNAPSDMKSQMKAMSASKALGKMGPAAVPRLIECLKSKNPRTRYWTLNALASIGDRRAIDPMLVCLKDKNGTVRCVATYRLGRWVRVPKVGQAIVEQLKDPSPDVRKWAIRVITERKYQPAVPRLREMLKSADPATRSSGLMTIASFRPPWLAHEVEAMLATEKDEGVRTQIYEVIKQAKLKSPQIVASLEKGLRAPSAKVRFESLTTLAEVAPDRVTNAAVELYKTDKEYRVRAAALRALAQQKVHDARLVETLLLALRDENEKIRRAAYKMLRYYTDAPIRFEAEAKAPWRNKQAAEWDRWWQEHKATFKFRGPR